MAFTTTPDRSPVPNVLRRTGRMVAFCDLNLGHPFFKHERLWVRIDAECALQLVGLDQPQRLCNFVDDPQDQMVELVTLVPA